MASIKFLNQRAFAFANGASFAVLAYDSAKYFCDFIALKVSFSQKVSLLREITNKLSIVPLLLKDFIKKCRYKATSKKAYASTNEQHIQAMVYLWCNAIYKSKKNFKHFYPFLWVIIPQGAIRANKLEKDIENSTNSY